MLWLLTTVGKYKLVFGLILGIKNCRKYLIESQTKAYKSGQVCLQSQITYIKCKHWTLPLASWWIHYHGYYSKTKTGTREKSVSCQKQWGLKPCVSSQRDCGLDKGWAPGNYLEISLIKEWDIEPGKQIVVDPVRLFSSVHRHKAFLCQYCPLFVL